MKAIKKNNINKLLDYLIKKNQVFAPVQKDDLIIDFEQIQSGEQAYLDFYNTNEPAKKLFFPQAETLFSYTKDDPAQIPELKPARHRVIFGMRPCDAKSLTLLDAVFDGDKLKDPYYVAKRKNTTIFTLACNNPLSNCFCRSLGFGPYFKKDTDVFVVDLGDQYLLEPITPAGEKILKGAAGLDEAQDKDINRIKKLKSEAMKKIASKVNVEDLPEKLTDLFDHPIWDEMHETCLGCGVCTYFCPTCHCFDMVDEQKGNQGRRVRIWDSCSYSGFTQEASGHNPRQTGKERVRQRLMHKFRYFVENFGEMACVGCGRCMNKCPTGSGLLREIEDINKLEVEKST